MSFCDGLPDEGNRLRRLRTANEITIHGFFITPLIRTHKMIDWLVFYGTSTQDRSICANLLGGLRAQAFEDSQRETYKNIQLHAIQWTYTCNELSCNNPAIKQWSFLLNYYIRTFNNTKQDPQNNNVTQYTIKYSSYTNATTGDLACLLLG